MPDVRLVNTPKMIELVRMDCLSDAYRKGDEFVHGIDPLGQHMLVMMLPFVNVEHARDIVVHRVEAMAKMRDTQTPYRFMIDLPASHWEKLTKMEGVA